jgi:hypothetical protein
MGKIIYQSHRVKERSKGKSKKLIITALFYNASHPERKITYGRTAIINAIRERRSQEKRARQLSYFDILEPSELDNFDTNGLEIGLEKINSEYSSRGLQQPESRVHKRQRQRAFANG